MLRTYPLGEADRLVSFLSRSAGRLRGVARGARRPRSRFGSTLEPLSYIRIWFFERETRELVRINQCELLESFLEAQRDYHAGLALAMISEITEAVLPEREPSDAAFRLALVAARNIQAGRGVELSMAYFNLWTVRLAGWLPQLDRCGFCGRELGAADAYASPFAVGFACKDCRRPGMRLLARATLALGQRMLVESLEQVFPKGPSPAAIAQLSGYLLGVIEHQIERKLNTRKLLESSLEPQS